MIPNGQQAAHYRDDVIASLLVTVHDWMITTDMFKILIKMHFYLLLSTYAFFFFFLIKFLTPVSHTFCIWLQLTQNFTSPSIIQPPFLSTGARATLKSLAVICYCCKCITSLPLLPLPACSYPCHSNERQHGTAANHSTVSFWLSNAAQAALDFFLAHRLSL